MGLARGMRIRSKETIARELPSAFKEEKCRKESPLVRGLRGEAFLKLPACLPASQQRGRR